MVFYNFVNVTVIEDSHLWCSYISFHYGDVIMGAIASQITSLAIVYSTVYSDTNQRKHQSSASLSFVRGIHRGPVNSPHKWPVTRKMFPFDDVIMSYPIMTSPTSHQRHDSVRYRLDLNQYVAQVRMAKFIQFVMYSLTFRFCQRLWSPECLVQNIVWFFFIYKWEFFFRVAGHLCGEFIGHRWIPRTKASEAELWCFLWSAPE